MFGGDKCVVERVAYITTYARPGTTDQRSERRNVAPEFAAFEVEGSRFGNGIFRFIKGGYS